MIHLPGFTRQIKDHGEVSVMFPEPLATWIENSKRLDSEYAWSKVTLDDVDMMVLEDLLSELFAFEAMMEAA